MLGINLNSWNIPLTNLRGKGHLEGGIALKSCYMVIRIQNFNILIDNDVPRCNDSFTTSFSINIKSLGIVRMHLQSNPLEIQGNDCHVLMHSGDCRELMIDPIDMIRGNRSSL